MRAPSSESTRSPEHAPPPIGTGLVKLRNHRQRETDRNVRRVLGWIALFVLAVAIVAVACGVILWNRRGRTQTTGRRGEAPALCASGGLRFA